MRSGNRAIERPTMMTRPTGTASAGVSTSAVSADADALAAFVDRGRRLLDALQGVEERLVARRSSVTATLGADEAIGVRGAESLDELIGRVTETVSFVDGVQHDLVTSTPLLGPRVADPGPQSPRHPAHRLLIDLGFAPDPHAGFLTWPLYVAANSSLATAATADWMDKVRTHRFQPRPIGGRWRSVRDIPRHRWPGLARNPDSWNPRRGQAARAGRWSRVGRWAGRAGTVTVLVGSGWAEWRRSGADPSLPTSQRVGRTVTMGATTALGSWGGVTAGSYAGATIGTFLCPGAGTVIGGLAGGFVGGIIGGSAGARVGEELKDFGGDIAQGTVELVRDIGNLGDDALDALAFWN